MKSKILPIIISNLAVAIIAGAVVSVWNNDSAALAQKDQEIQNLKNELAKKQTRTQTTRTNRSRVATNDNANQQDADDAKTQEQRRAEMTQRRAQFQQMRTNAAITRLSLRLKLTDEQKAQLAGLSEKRGALDSQMGTLMESMRNARENGTDTADIESQIQALREQMRGLDPENYVAEILTDEQKIQYETYEQERATNRAETQATMSLSMIQEAVPLSQEQKDKYFSAYATAALNSENGRVGIEETKTILKDILSNEEYSAIEEQISTAAGMFGGRGGPAGGPGGNGRRGNNQR